MQRSQRARFLASLRRGSSLVRKDHVVEDLFGSLADPVGPEFVLEAGGVGVAAETGKATVVFECFASVEELFGCHVVDRGFLAFELDGAVPSQTERLNTIGASTPGDIAVDIELDREPITSLEAGRQGDRSSTRTAEQDPDLYNRRTTNADCSAFETASRDNRAGGTAVLTAIAASGPGWCVDGLDLTR